MDRALKILPIKVLKKNCVSLFICLAQSEKQLLKLCDAARNRFELVSGWPLSIGTNIQTKRFGPLGPLLPCQDLHVLDLVHFVDDLHAQEGFDHIFSGHKTFGPTVLIDYQSDVLAFVEQKAEKVRKGHVPGYRFDFPFQCFESDVAATLRLDVQQVVLKNESGDMIQIPLIKR